MIKSRLIEEERKKVSISVGESVADIPHILPLVRLMHKESLFSDLPFDQAQYEKICSFIRNTPSRHGGLYAEYMDEPVAFAYFVYRPFMGSQDTWVTFMHTLYMRNDVRSTPIGGYIWERIMLAVRAWSTPRNSRGIMFNVLSGIATEETDMVLRASGSTHLGGNYFMRL